jgi:hypothetical protein
MEDKLSFSDREMNRRAVIGEDDATAPITDEDHSRATQEIAEQIACAPADEAHTGR